MWRLFIALELPEEVLQKIQEVQIQLKKATPKTAVRWVRPDGIHLTLKFLGDTPKDQVDALKNGLRHAVRGIGPITLRAEGLGCFPNTHRPRNVWVGVNGDIDILRALHREIEQEMDTLGFDPEGRKFSPHLTLARAARHGTRDELARLGEIVEKTQVGILITWQAQAVGLIQSHLKPSGAVYEQVVEIPLI